MKKEEIFNRRLNLIKEYSATTTPEKDGFYFCTVLTKEKISADVNRKLTEIGELRNYEKGDFEDRGYCKLRHKYIFKIPAGTK